MKPAFWIIIGFVAIIVGTIAPLVAFYYARESLFYDKNLFSFFDKFLIVGVLSQIGFWGGIISVIFGLIKYSKER